MKIIIPVAAPISYNPCWYLEKAFKQLGHEARVVDQSELYTLSSNDADIFFGVDSGGPLNVPEQFLHKFGMWFIDSRRNHKPEIRQPDDDTFALKIINNGGHVFQAQREDYERIYWHPELNNIKKYKQIHILYLAADTDVWNSEPFVGNKQHLCSFVGNCYDETRLSVLNNLSEKGLLHWPGIEKAVMEEGAAVYRNSICGLNIPSWYGTKECYDINMRVFEIMSCGIPLITNYLPNFYYYALGFMPNFLGQEVHNDVYVYRSLEEIPALIEQVKALSYFKPNKNREIILNKHTYVHRAKQILKVMS